ncbi:MAG: hypothetical protein U1F35_04245 [Steroidobacteraceae bacterium]
MRSTIGMIFTYAAVLLCYGCNSDKTVSSVTAAKASVLVTFDGPNNNCVVASKVDGQYKSMPCSEVTSFLMATLKLPQGALFEVATNPDVDESAFDQTMADLKGSGFNRNR